MSAPLSVPYERTGWVDSQTSNHHTLNKFYIFTSEENLTGFVLAVVQDRHKSICFQIIESIENLTVCIQLEYNKFGQEKECPKDINNVLWSIDKLYLKTK